MSTVRLGDFEWDARKATSNLKKHGVSFEEATTALLDPRAIDAPDLMNHERSVVIGMSRLGRVLFVVVTERRDRIRIISARRASPVQRRKYEEDT